MKVIILVVLAYVAFESVQGWAVRQSDEVVDQRDAEVLAGLSTLKVSPSTPKQGKATAKPKPGKQEKPSGKPTKPGKQEKPSKGTKKPGNKPVKQQKPTPVGAKPKPGKATNKPGKGDANKKPAPMELPAME